FYNSWVSLLGTLICVVVMFMIQWEVALATFGITITLYLLVHYRKPKANWGSSTQAQVYSTALKNSHALNKTAEHVKNYRPQLLVLSGPPSSRPSLLDFAYLLTKTNSLLIIGHVVKAVSEFHVIPPKQPVNTTYHLENIFQKPCLDTFNHRSGKIKPRDGDAFDNHTAVGILRLQEGLDYSEILEEVPVLAKEAMKTNKSDVFFGETGAEVSSLSTPQVSQMNHSTEEMRMKGKKKVREKQKTHHVSQMYCGLGGTPLPKTLVDSLTQFQQKQKGGRIDVWWLYDDGGLTILLPYILTQRAQFSSASLRRAQFSSASLRVFSLASSKGKLEQEQRSLAALLSKFRIDYSDVVVVADIQKKATPETHQEFDALIEPFKEKVDETRETGTYITSAELVAKRDKSNRHMRLRELLLHNSIDASLIVMTLPMPRKGMISAPLYMAWLEILTKGMPPFLFVRGNQTSVITFYS
ncbi:unnamed protein product, partial [Darwinula stevensoni]